MQVLLKCRKPTSLELIYITTNHHLALPTDSEAGRSRTIMPYVFLFVPRLCHFHSPKEEKKKKRKQRKRRATIYHLVNKTTSCSGLWSSIIPIFGIRNGVKPI